MPIVKIQSTQTPTLTALQTLIHEIRTEGARALDCGPDNLWVVYEPIPPTHSSVHPPVVTIQANAGRPREMKSRLAQAVVTAVSHALAVPSAEIWLYYQELDPKEVWFQNRWSSGV